jgi:hypothetical protein
MRRSAWTLSLLLLFTGVAAVLRTVGLNSQLWCDEITFEVDSVRKSTLSLLTTYSYDNQHTFYALLAQAAVMLFGDEPWVLRLPAMVFGTTSVAVLYLLGRELTRRIEALAAAGLLAVSYHHIWFSQNARGYTALMLADLLATWCLVRGWKRPSWRPWLLYAVVVALGMYTHLTMLFVVVSHAILCGWLVLRSIRENREPRIEHGDYLSPPAIHLDWRRPVVSFALAGMLTLLLYAPMLADVWHFFLHKPTGMKGVSTPGWALTEAWNILQKGLGGQPLIAVPALLAAALVTGCGLWSYRRDPLALGLLVLPALITFAGALAGRGTMYPRFFFYLMGFGLLVVARGIMVLSQGILSLLAREASPRYVGLAGAVLVGLLMIGSAASLGANYRWPKQDFAGAIAYVEANRADGEPVVVAGLASEICLQRYYCRPWDEVRSPEQLAKVRGTGRRVWVVYTMPRYLEQQYPDLALAIREQFAVVHEFPGTLGGGAVLVCRAEPLSQRPPKP